MRSRMSNSHEEPTSKAHEQGFPLKISGPRVLARHDPPEEGKWQTAADRRRYFVRPGAEANPLNEFMAACSPFETTASTAAHARSTTSESSAASIESKFWST